MYIQMYYAQPKFKNAYIFQKNVKKCLKYSFTKDAFSNWIPIYNRHLQLKPKKNQLLKNIWNYKLIIA